MKEKAVVLLSGGLDSTTTLGCALRDDYECYTLSFCYGQRNSWENSAAEKISAQMGASEHKLLSLPLDSFGGSSLVGSSPVEKGRSLEEISHGVPKTYVPCRNTVFLTMALCWAEVLEASAIFIGVNAVDYSGYPDCRPEYLQAFAEMAALATRMTTERGKYIAIKAPLVTLSKSEIVRLGLELNVPFELTSTCYDPLDGGKPCGQCDACILRRKGFTEAGFNDPLSYS